MKNSTLTKKNLTLKPKPKSGAILVKDEVADAEDNKINGNIEKIIEIWNHSGSYQMGKQMYISYINQFISRKEGLVMVIDKDAQFDIKALSNHNKYEFI